MPEDAALREHLVQLLEGGHAHTSFDQATRGFPVARAGERPSGAPYSAWELLEHMRIAQNDILRFSQSAKHKSPDWPAGYWPASPAPERADQWSASLRSFKDDLAEFLDMVRDLRSDLYRKFPWGDGQTLLREALLIADHNAYHLGQLVLVRRLLGEWKE
jgi:DinB superfamily